MVFVQLDLTPVRCLSREHAGGSFLGQMWVSAVPGGDVHYTWDKSKKALVAVRIIPDDWKGLLQTDGGSELGCYLRGGKARGKPPDIRRAACWAHVRRGLHRRIERTIREERPQSPVAKACLYTKGQWEGLQTFLKHGEVEIDNNSVENGIRPCALGKKNYLFIGDVGAGERSAVFYSLLGSCLRRGINPHEYLHWLFTRLPVTLPKDHPSLPPAAYAAEHQQPAAEPIAA